jgi:hypothetical protein
VEYGFGIDLAPRRINFSRFAWTKAVGNPPDSMPPGNALVAGPASEGQHEFIFASIWADADAVKARFGEQWRVSLLPPGYADLIEECSVDHYHLTGQSLDRQ